MAKGGDCDSDDNSIAKAKDWEMMSIASSCTSEVYTEPCDYPDDFIFPPKLHEGLPIKSYQGSGIVNSQLGFNDYTDDFEENHKNETPEVVGWNHRDLKRPNLIAQCMIWVFVIKEFAFRKLRRILNWRMRRTKLRSNI